MTNYSRLKQRKMRRLLFLVSFFLLAMIANAQQRTISGTVTNKTDNSPLAGATIASSKLSVATSAEGKFTIAANTGETLTITYIGMKTQTVKVGNESELTIQLEPGVIEGDQVVVVGYQTQRKADLTGAVTVVDMNDINKLPNNNPIQALQGRIPGMIVYTDGSPSGSNVNVQIRGVGSINGNAPLYVIDGVATFSGMHELNPNDIESIQVLKDAAAATIYGARAASGVIIITTKRAKRGVTSVTANARGSYSWYSTKMQVLDAEGYGSAVWQASANDGSPLNKYLIYKFDYARDANNNFILNKILLPEFVDTTTRTMRTANTNWFDEISQPAYSQNYNISLSRGTDKGGSVFSLDYLHNKGIVRTTDFKRMTARINSDYKLINDKLWVGENFSVSRTQEVSDPGVLNPALQALPVIPVHTIDGVGWGGPFGGMNDRQNPARIIEDNKQNHYTFIRLFGNAFADLEIVKNLHARTSIGLDYGNFDKRDMQLSYVSGYLNNPDNKVTMNHFTTSQVIWTNTLNYKRDWLKHSLDAIAGHEIVKYNGLTFGASRMGFASENIDYMYLNAGTGLKDNYGGASETRLMSYFGKVNYVFDRKYLASATLRYDGSSRFGKNNQFALFPAFSVGWRLNNEDFIKDNYDFISDLKLRYGWGVTGNQENIDATANRTLYATNYAGGDPTWRTPDGTAYDLDGVGSGTLPSGFQLIQRSNDDVRWESMTQSNFGIDFGFFNQKIYGSADYFVKTTSDMLVRPAYIGVIGEGGYRWVNGASMKNKGFELLIGYKGLIASTVNFDVTGNLGTYRNKVISLPESVVNTYGGNGTTDNILGRPWGSGYGYVADGLFQNADEVANSAEQGAGKGLGRIRYKDLNGDGTIDQKDRTWIVNPNPAYTYGLNINIGYKGFDFMVFFQGVGPVDLNVYDVKSMTDFWSINETGSNKGTRLLEAWSPTNTSSTIPALTLTDRNNETRFSTYFIENGAYMKLRNIQLGYTLPSKISEKISAKSLNVYVSGQNLFTIKSKKFTGVDPETPAWGYPIPSMATAGVRLTF